MFLLVSVILWMLIVQFSLRVSKRHSRVPGTHHCSCSLFIIIRMPLLYSRAVKMIDEYALSIPIKPGKRIEINSHRVNLLVIHRDNISSDSIEFPEESSSAVSSIEFPVDALTNANTVNHRVLFVLYKNSKLFPSSKAGHNVHAESEVVAASVSTGPLKNLSNLVVLKFRDHMVGSLLL